MLGNTWRWDQIWLDCLLRCLSTKVSLRYVASAAIIAFIKVVGKKLLENNTTTEVVLIAIKSLGVYTEHRQIKEKRKIGID